MAGNTKGKKGAATIAPPTTQMTTVSIGTTEFHVGNMEIKSAALKREYALSCKAILKAATAVQGAYYDIAKSFARVQDGELYKPDFANMTEYVAKGFGMEETKAASTISIFVKAGREYLLADKAVQEAKERAETVLADPEMTDADRDAATKAVEKAETVRNIHAAMTPARIAEMRNVSAVQAIADGKIDGTETLRQLREVNKSLAPVKAKARAEKRVQVSLYSADMYVCGNPVIIDSNAVADVEVTAYGILSDALSRKLNETFLPLLFSTFDLTYERYDDTKAAFPIDVYYKTEDGKEGAQTITSVNHKWYVAVIYNKMLQAVETYYVCVSTLKGSKSTSGKGKGKGKSK